MTLNEPSRSHSNRAPWLLWIILTALAGTLGAQISPGRSLKSGDTFTLSGTVLNSVTGESIGRALVRLNGFQQRTCFSDSNGHFEFDGLQPGRVYITAQKPGYFSEQELPGSSASSVDVRANTDTALVKLAPQSAIGGRIIDAAGQPVERVPVRLLNRSVRDGRKRWELRGSAETDEDGRFRFAGLMPGTYYVAAGPSLNPNRLLRGGEKPKTGYPGLYYPGVPDLSAASPLQLVAGQQAQADFSISAVPVYHVSGVISGYPPDQGVGLQLSGQSGDMLSLQTRFNMETGRFELEGAPAGVYVMRAFSQVGPRRLFAETQLNITANIENAQLSLAPVPSIPIVVRVDSRAASSSGTTAIEQGPPVSVRLTSMEPMGAEFYSTIERSPVGTFSAALQHVDPGKYSVDVTPHGPWYVQSAQYGQTNLLYDDLTIAPNGQALPMEIVLRDDAATLTGTLKPGDGTSPRATVLVIPESGSKAAAKTAQTMAAEGFTIPGFAPGDYLVFAFDSADGIEYASTDALQPYISQAAHVTLSANQKAQVVLDVIHREGGN